MSENLIFFASPNAFRAWLEQNHHNETELHVGYYKKGTGKPSMTWQESVDQALCFGWIDGVRRSIDEESYKIRFTPRKTTSTWSSVNIKRVGELTEQGLMHPAGLKAFEQRKGERSGIYAYEQPDEVAKLSDADEQQFRANEKAWEWFQKQAAWYKRGATWWVVSAKQEKTRVKRLATLIEDSENERTIASANAIPYEEVNLRSVAQRFDLTPATRRTYGSLRVTPPLHFVQRGILTAGYIDCSAFFDGILDFGGGVAEIGIVVGDVNLAVRADDAIVVGFDPLDQRGMPLRKILKIAMMHD